MSTLHQQLHTLAAHIRSPDTHEAPPGIAPHRVAVYRDLVMNNLNGLLSSTFPVLHATLPDAAWERLLRHFLATHHSKTPLFTEIGNEFLQFLEANPSFLANAPWLEELAHYEWAELALQLRDATLPAHNQHADLLGSVPMLSPLAWPLAYRWPVHRIAPDYQPIEPPDLPTFLLLRRESDGRICFSQLSPFLYRLLEMVEHNHSHKTADALLRELAAEAGQTHITAFFDEAAPMLHQLYREGVLLHRPTEPT
jgi:uncharacterized protein